MPVKSCILYILFHPLAILSPPELGCGSICNYSQTASSAKSALVTFQTSAACCCFITNKAISQFCNTNFTVSFHFFSFKPVKGGLSNTCKKLYFVYSLSPLACLSPPELGCGSICNCSQTASFAKSALVTFQTSAACCC